MYNHCQQEGENLKWFHHCPRLSTAKMVGIVEKERSKVIYLLKEVALGKRNVEHKMEMSQAEVGTEKG